MTDGNSLFHPPLRSVVSTTSRNSLTSQMTDSHLFAEADRMKNRIAARLHSEHDVDYFTDLVAEIIRRHRVEA